MKESLRINQEKRLLFFFLCKDILRDKSLRRNYTMYLIIVNMTILNSIPIKMKHSF